MPDEKIPIDLSDAEFEKDYEFPKSNYYLPEDFEETKLGYLDDAIKQYRGPDNQHVKEYDTYYLGHRDHKDPRTDPMGHFVRDAPESIIAILAGSILGIILAVLLLKWKEKKDLNDKKVITRLIIFIIAAIVIVILFTIGILYLGKYIMESKRERVVLN